MDKLTSIREFLVLFAGVHLITHQVDVVTASLNGDLREVVHMEQAGTGFGAG